MKTILVCYEERPVAGRVLERAAELAGAFGAKVVVTSVAPVVHGRGLGPYDPADPPERHETELHEAAARLGELGVTRLETVTGVGDPARAILDLADHRGAELIVIGAHDGGLMSRLFDSSTSDTVVHKAHADVLVVH